MPPVATTTAAGRELERTHQAGARHGPVDAVGRQHVAAHTGDDAVGGDQARHAVPEPYVDEAVATGVEERAHERLEDARPGAPGDVEPGHRVAVPAGRVPAALGPLHEREPRTPWPSSHGPHVSGGEVDEPLGPRAAPPVVGAELGGPQPVGQRELGGVLDAQAPLLGGVHQEQAAERPERLAAEDRRVLGVEQGHVLAGGEQLGGGDEPGQARADDNDGVGHGSSPYAVWTDVQKSDQHVHPHAHGLDHGASPGSACSPPSIAAARCSPGCSRPSPTPGATGRRGRRPARRASRRASR